MTQPQPDATPIADSNFENPTKSSAAEASFHKRGSTDDFKFEEPDWARFRTLDGLCQKAGVGLSQLPNLVLKELFDNALDVGYADYGFLDHGFFVEDDGPGISDDPNAVARLFSISRPLTSSKKIRLPTRGALGNGLRVVAGFVLASGGALSVETRGKKMNLFPRDDGSTDVEVLGASAVVGTRVEVTIGEPLRGIIVWPQWVHRARRLSSASRTFSGRTSAYWYTDEAFFELLQAAGKRTVRDMVAEFDGCTGAKAGRLSAALARRTCHSMSRDEATQLLGVLRQATKQINPARLGFVGNGRWLPAAYSRSMGTFLQRTARGSFDAPIPFVVEAWAQLSESSEVLIHVNRTAITSEVDARRCQKPKSDIAIIGCGVQHRFYAPKDVQLWINITTPFMPITSDGKAPDLSILVDDILDAAKIAARRATRLARIAGEPAENKKSVINALIPDALQKASGNGSYRYSIRQLYYAVRPGYLAKFKEEPDYNYFCAVVTEFEAEQASDLPGIYRDPRGVLYHPHSGEHIPLGTVNVEEYARPSWTFNKVLYCEKEGFISILVEAKWPERHDCALMTGKGYASRAARDLIDFLAASDEPISVFCIHDADGPGTMIYESLQRETAARGARKIEIVNLGLDPEQALAMGLEPEPVTAKDKIPVAPYLADEWRTWLQTQRVELNAMTTPQFLEWLDAQMAPYDSKVVPPQDVMRAAVEYTARNALRETMQSAVLDAAGFEGMVDQANELLEAHVKSKCELIASTVARHLAHSPPDPWRRPASSIAESMAAEVFASHPEIIE